MEQADESSVLSEPLIKQAAESSFAVRGYFVSLLI